MSPDYGVRVPESLVTIEVTVWHWEAYAAWHRMYKALHEILSRRLRKRGISKHVRILLPIGSPQEIVKWLWSNDFCAMLADQESGSIETVAGVAPKPIRVNWCPMPHFDSMENVDWEAVAATGGQFTVGGGLAHSFGLAVNPCIDDEARDSALASLRRSIDLKKRQCDPTLPHFLAISPTFPRIAASPDRFANTWEVFGPLIEGRLWPNERYSWLSGILQCTPNRVAPSDGNPYFIGYNPNPNAAVPAPETAMRALTGQAEFHMMWQRPRNTDRSKFH
jgi:hypothetical protein